MRAQNRTVIKEEDTDGVKVHESQHGHLAIQSVDAIDKVGESIKDIKLSTGHMGASVASIRSPLGLCCSLGLVC